MSKTKRLNRDHAKKTQRPMVEDRVIAEHLTNLLTPTIKSQSSFFRKLGFRDKVLTLPLHGAFRTLLWRDVLGVTELTRLLETDSDTRFEEKLLDLVSAQTLLLLDRGFYHFQFWQTLIEQGARERCPSKGTRTVGYFTQF